MLPFTDSTPLLDDPDALRARFSDDGYVFVRGAVDPNVVLEVRERITTIIADAGWTDPERSMDAVVTGEGVCVEGEDPYFAVYDQIQRLEAFHAVPHQPSVHRLMRALLGETVFPHPLGIARLSFPANDAWATPAHQDYPNNQGTEDLYACWIPLGACPVELGGLSILSGSHRLGVLPLEFALGAGNRRAVLDDRCEDLDWVGGDFELGDAVVFHSLTLHRSLPNQTDRMRLSIDYRFQRQGEPLTEGCLEPHFGRLRWAEIYDGWERTDLQYYWQALQFDVAPWDPSHHAMPDAALEEAIRDYLVWRKDHPRRGAPRLDPEGQGEVGGKVGSRSGGVTARRWRYCAPEPGAALRTAHCTDASRCPSAAAGSDPRYSGAFSRRFVGASANRLVLRVHLVPRVAPRRGRPTVVLVERSLAEQHDQLYPIERTCPPVQVVVDEPATGEIEAFVEPAQFVPQRTRHEQRAALTHRTEPAARGGARQGADGEQAGTVVLPARGREQLVLRPLVISGGDCLHVLRGAQVVGRARDHATRCEPARELGRREQAGRGHARAVDDETDEIPRRRVDAHVRGVGRRRRRRIDSDDARGRPLVAEITRVDGYRRAVVDDDDLRVSGVAVALIGRCQRSERPGELAGHVVRDDDNAEPRGHGARHLGHRRSVPSYPARRTMRVVRGMPAAVYTGEGRIEVQTLPVPEPGTGARPRRSVALRDLWHRPAPRARAVRATGIGARP